jgi:hypothetical protein
MAWIKLDCINQESTVFTDIHNYSNCRLANLYFPIFADDIYLAPYVILYCPNPTRLLWSLYRNIKYLTIANKTTEQDSELRKIDRDRSEHIIHQLSSEFCCETKGAAFASGASCWSKGGEAERSHPGSLRYCCITSNAS